jgi:hypothetical protein
MPESPRAARCVVRQDGEVLVEEHVDPEAGGRVYRPPGRTVDDDADPADAVRQSFEDVLGVALTDLSVLGTFDDTLVFEGDVDSDWLYDEAGFTLYDPESGETDRVCWLHLDDFRRYGETLLPDGLLDALAGDPLGASNH